MAIYFEKRTYARTEIAEAFGFDPKDKKFAQKVKTRLTNLGFSEEDYIYTRKDITILWVPTTSAEKITYLVRLLGIDTKVNPHNFAMFLYSLIKTEDLQTMPWAERSSWMKDNYGIEISERALRRWTSKLLELGVLAKEKRMVNGGLPLNSKERLIEIWSLPKRILKNYKIIGKIGKSGAKLCLIKTCLRNYGISITARFINAQNFWGVLGINL